MHNDLLHLIILITCTKTCQNSKDVSWVTPVFMFHSVYNWYGRKSKMSAPQYIDLVMTHIQKHVEDESCLPSKYGKVFYVLVSKQEI